MTARIAAKISTSLTEASGGFLSPARQNNFHILHAVHYNSNQRMEAAQTAVSSAQLGLQHK